MPATTAPRRRATARRRGPRVVASLNVVLLLLVACETGEAPAGEDPSTIVIDEGEEEPSPEPGPSAEPDGGQPPSDGAGPDQDPAARDGTDEPTAEPDAEPSDASSSGARTAAEVPDDRGPLGSACRAYLRGEVPGLTVEVLQQSGAGLSAGVLDHLVSTLEEVLDKPAGVRVAGPRAVPGEGRTWSVDDLRGFLDEHRRERSDGDRLAMVVLAVSGGFEQEGVLGVAVSATEIVLFPDQIGDLGTSLLGGRAPVERAVLVHEAGHLLCLVNISYTSAIDHEDPDNPRHSRHRDSVMFWAVPNDAVSRAFRGAPPDTFHPDDLADLENLRQGRY